MKINFTMAPRAMTDHIVFKYARSLAARLGKKIIYIPIGMFSPVTLKRLPQFHVLDGHHVRK